jgi:hypothetical protein
MNTKIFFYGIAVLAIVIGAASNVSLINSQKRSSSIYLANQEALASENGYSCTATYNCSYNSGSISCTGVKECKRGTSTFLHTPWVECDGKRTYC